MSRFESLAIAFHMDKASAIAKLSALAQPVRLDIYLTIVAHEDGIGSTHVAELTGALPTNTSVHLAILKNAGLVSATKHGRSVTYRAIPQAMNALLEFLSAANSQHQSNAHRD